MPAQPGSKRACSTVSALYQFNTIKRQEKRRDGREEGDDAEAGVPHTASAGSELLPFVVMVEKKRERITATERQIEEEWGGKTKGGNC